MEIDSNYLSVSLNESYKLKSDSSHLLGWLFSSQIPKHHTQKRERK